MFIKRIALIFSCMMILGAMTACAGGHTHTENDKWETDSKEHWKQCDDCEEKTEIGEHTLNDESKCTVCGSEIIDFGDTVSVYTYDEQGNITRIAEYDAENNLVSDIANEFEYDSDGNILKEAQYIDGKLCGEAEYTVADGESIPTKYTGYYEDGSKYVNEYDSYGNNAKMISYNADGTVELQIESQYAQGTDGEWYEVNRTESYSDGTKIECEYNEQTDILTRVCYDADGNKSRTETWEYTYGADGNKSTEKYYVEGVITQEMEYAVVSEDGGTYCYPETIVDYNEDGSKKVCVYSENDELLSETQYDASGNVLE